MKIINWMKKNYLIVVLFIITVWILIVKINIKIQNNKNGNLPAITPIKVEPIPTNKNQIDLLVSPTPTIINIDTYGNKSKEEILRMEPEERYDFISELSREEIEELDMMPNYDFSNFLPYTNKDFIVEKFDYQNKKLTVKPLIDDKNKIKEEVNAWLFYENGNNPKKIEIIWSQ